MGLGSKIKAALSGKGSPEKAGSISQNNNAGSVQPGSSTGSHAATTSAHAMTGHSSQEASSGTESRVNAKHENTPIRSESTDRSGVPSSGVINTLHLDEAGRPKGKFAVTDHEAAGIARDPTGSNSNSNKNTATGASGTTQGSDMSRAVHSNINTERGTPSGHSNTQAGQSAAHTAGSANGGVAPLATAGAGHKSHATASESDPLTSAKNASKVTGDTSALPESMETKTETRYAQPIVYTRVHDEYHTTVKTRIDEIYEHTHIVQVIQPIKDVVREAPTYTTKDLGTSISHHNFEGIDTSEEQLAAARDQYIRNASNTTYDEKHYTTVEEPKVVTMHRTNTVHQTVPVFESEIAASQKSHHRLYDKLTGGSKAHTSSESHETQANSSSTGPSTTAGNSLQQQAGTQSTATTNNTGTNGIHKGDSVPVHDKHTAADVRAPATGDFEHAKVA